MDQLSKITSLAIGLIIVVISFAVFTGKVDLGNKFPKFFSNSAVKITPTLAPVQVKSDLQTETQDPELKQAETINKYNYEGNIPSTIPATGNPTAVLILSTGMLALGSYLRRIK